MRDTGVGFEPTDAERLFERFEQADGSITRQFGGTGLGLSICRQLSELMGGTIRASGRKGEGAAFVVTLPLGPVTDGAETAEPGAPLRVLAVDDNPTNLKIIELMLETIGAQVATAQNGAVAIEAVAHGAFDLILMDMQMPVMDGLSATRAIRTRAGAPPVIMVSANNSPADRAASAQAGVVAHIGKPFAFEDLIGAIAGALQNRPLIQVA